MNQNNVSKWSNMSTRGLLFSVSYLDLISTYPDRVPLSSSTGLLKQRTDKTEGSESYFVFYIIIIFLLSLMRYTLSG
jgi:hypothetical protein